jgi:hypothetical protein
VTLGILSDFVAGHQGSPPRIAAFFHGWQPQGLYELMSDVSADLLSCHLGIRQGAPSSLSSPPFQAENQQNENAHKVDDRHRNIGKRLGIIKDGHDDGSTDAALRSRDLARVPGPYVLPADEAAKRDAKDRNGERCDVGA